MHDSPNASLSLNAQMMLDKICDAFEKRLRSGEEPLIEDALADSPAELRPHLYHELRKQESEYRQQQFEDDHRRRFPEYAAKASDDADSSELTTYYGNTLHARDAAYPLIPGYEILAKLGEGYMGVVYKAHQLKLDRVVALKMMRAGQFAGAHERQRFRFEAEAIAGLDHAHIVPVYDVGEVGGEDFLCLKFLNGGSLAERLRKHRYTPTETAALMLAITRGVQHAHERGFLHRDLKPGNILLDAAGQPHVADFGLARRIASDHSFSPTGAIVGTLNYMAPEQARGEKGLTVKADVYALGAILYELLTGVPPFKGDTPQETLALLCSESPAIHPRQRNAETPRDLEAICLKCLEKDPANRYAAASDLADDLGCYLRNEPISVQPPGIWDWLVQALRTRPATSAEHTWQSPILIGGVLFVQHFSVMLLIQTDQPVWMLWGTMLAGSLGAFLVLWFLNLPRFRVVPVTERHSITAALGHLVAQVVLLMIVTSGDPRGSCRSILAMYPALTVVSGLCLFILGSTNWGRLFSIGLMIMCLALLVAAYPEFGPLIYTATVPVTISAWGFATWWYFVPSKASPVA